MRPLEAAARRVGVEILLEHRMTALYREKQARSACSASPCDNAHGVLNIRARKAVIIATGGSTGNVNFRRMFDPRLTEEYCGLAGMPWSDQDASGELAAMAVGASLWGAYNQTGEFGETLTKPGLDRHAVRLPESALVPGHRVFAQGRRHGLAASATGRIVILVNMLGQRFYDETAGNYTANNYGRVDPYTPYSHLNLTQHDQLEPERLDQRGAGRDRRRTQRRRTDLGDLRRRRGAAREVGPNAAARRHRARLLLQRRDARGARDARS